jgi:hypothetical protein
VRREIVELGGEISCLKEKVEVAEAANEEERVERLSTQLMLLREMELKLREKENLLMQMELKLMDQRGAAQGQWASLRACTDPMALPQPQLRD